VIFILVTLALVAGIAFFQSIQGSFSALIMAVLTVVSACIAVNYYGQLSTAMLLQHIPDYADAACLAGLFALSLGVLRTISDYVIRGNVLLPAMVDRILAGLISLPTALLIVGIASVAFQMLPFDPQVMLFRRFDEKMQARSGIFPYADQFAVGLLSTLSRGALSAEEDLGKIHPDWLREIHGNRAAVQRESRHAAPPESIKAQKTWELTDRPLLKKRQKYDRRGRFEGTEVLGQYQPSGDHMLLAIRTRFLPPAADPDKYHRFTPTQVRLVGFLGQRAVDYFPIGVQDRENPDEYNYLEPDAHIIDKASGGIDYDLVFEVPRDFKPWFIEYKRWARSLVPKMVKEAVQPAVARGGGEKPPPVGQVTKRGWKDFVVDPKRTTFTEQMPFPIQVASRFGRAGAGQAQIRDGKYAGGTVYGLIETNDPQDLQSALGGRTVTVDTFEVPSDKRLLRVECLMDQPEIQLLNQIFTSVGRVAPKYVMDSHGNRYTPVGQYVMIRQPNGGYLVELQYDPESAGFADRPRQFQYVSLGQMRRKQVTVGFLYLIDPGVELDVFEMGAGGPFRKHSLKGLVAPY